MKQEIKKLTQGVSVAGQIDVCDIDEIKNAGFATIINNRPDGEVSGQPTSEEIKQAAYKAGLSYYYLPLISRNHMSDEIIEQMSEVFEKSDKPILCYCRTGTRSTFLWALANAGKMKRVDIFVAAADAGYDVSSLKTL